MENSSIVPCLHQDINDAQTQTPHWIYHLITTYHNNSGHWENIHCYQQVSQFYIMIQISYHHEIWGLFCQSIDLHTQRCYFEVSSQFPQKHHTINFEMATNFFPLGQLQSNIGKRNAQSLVQLHDKYQLCSLLASRCKGHFNIDTSLLFTSKITAATRKLRSHGKICV